MAIEVHCPNGHVLKVKDKYAGKTGFCPLCEGRVRITVPQKLSEDDIMQFIGGTSAAAVKVSSAEDEASVLHGAAVGERTESSSMSLVGASAVRHPKKCPNCGEGVPYWYATCPHCHHFLSDGTVG
jgi:hypothetical protein